jgi:glyoxylase-like metal-dependent hydrolase (beta-lactamase superfamily II)
MRQERGSRMPRGVIAGTTARAAGFAAMSNRSLESFRVLAMALALTSCSTGGASRTSIEPSVKLAPCAPDVCARKLAGGVYALVSSTQRDDLGANAGFVVTPAGVVVIDTGMPGVQSARIREEIAKVTEAPLVAVIVTHKHWDHTLGGPLLVAPSVRVISSAAAAASLAKESPPFFARIQQGGGDFAALLAGKQPLAPTETLTEARSLDLGGTRFELVPLTPAHTAGDLLVYLPAQKVLFSGDIVVDGEYPYTAEKEMDFDGWAKALDRVAAIDAEKIVPGHGEVCGREAVADVRAFLTDLQKQGREAFAAGEPPEKAVARLATGARQAWRGRDTAVEDLKEMYRRLGQ